MVIFVNKCRKMQGAAKKAGVIVKIRENSIFTET